MGIISKASAQFLARVMTATTKTTTEAVAITNDDDDDVAHVDLKINKKDARTLEYNVLSSIV